MPRETRVQQDLLDSRAKKVQLVQLAQQAHKVLPVQPDLLEQRDLQEAMEQQVHLDLLVLLDYVEMMVQLVPQVQVV